MQRMDTELDRVYEDWYTHPEYNGGDNAAFFQHMPVLRLMCHNKRVIELGARFGTSTLAILASRPLAFTSVDIERRDTINLMERLAEDNNIPFTFYEVDDLVIAEDIKLASIVFDITFIDTLHTYDQLRQELAAYAPITNEYIVMHDIVSFGRSNEDGNTSGPQGLLPAIFEFLDVNPEWEIASYWYNCNGLMVLRRKG